MVAVLPKKVAASYECTTHHVVIQYGRRTVDLRSLTLEEAKELAADESFPYLRKKATVSKKKA